jgi:hypothetical protein
MEELLLGQYVTISFGNRTRLYAVSGQLTFSLENLSCSLIGLLRSRWHIIFSELGRDLLRCNIRGHGEELESWVLSSDLLWAIGLLSLGWQEWSEDHFGGQRCIGPVVRSCGDWCKQSPDFSCRLSRFSVLVSSLDEARYSLGTEGEERFWSGLPRKCNLGAHKSSFHESELLLATLQGSGFPLGCQQCTLAPSPFGAFFLSSA